MADTLPAPDLLAPLRVRLAALASTKDRAEGVRLADAIEAAGIEISDDEGRYLQADDVIDALGTPDDLGDFGRGYEEASRDFWHGEPGCDTDPDISEEEVDGAQMYRAVYAGLEFALESAQWRDMPSVPADDLAAMRRAAE